MKKQKQLKFTKKEQAIFARSANHIFQILWEKVREAGHTLITIDANRTYKFKDGREITFEVEAQCKSKNKK